MAQFRSYGFKTNAELAAESRAERKRRKEAEREGSKDFIGPPNPVEVQEAGQVAVSLF